MWADVTHRSQLGSWHEHHSSPMFGSLKFTGHVFLSGDDGPTRNAFIDDSCSIEFLQLGPMCSLLFNSFLDHCWKYFGDFLILVHNLAQQCFRAFRILATFKATLLVTTGTKEGAEFGNFHFRSLNIARTFLLYMLGYLTLNT